MGNVTEAPRASKPAAVLRLAPDDVRLLEVCLKVASGCHITDGAVRYLIQHARERLLAAIHTSGQDRVA